MSKRELLKVKDLHFYEDKEMPDNDSMVFAYYAGYRITVLDRMTGFGWRDTETGLKDYSIKNENDFWLASGQFDIRKYPELTVYEAIEKIKSMANTVVPQEEGNGE